MLNVVMQNVIAWVYLPLPPTLKKQRCSRCLTYTIKYIFTYFALLSVIFLMFFMQCPNKSIMQNVIMLNVVVPLSTPYRTKILRKKNFKF
jgi:hypothetical protein